MIRFSMSRTPAATGRKWLLCFAIILGMSLVEAIVFGGFIKQPMLAVWFSGTICVLLLAAFTFFDRSKHVRFEIGGGELRIRGDVFGRRIPLSSLKLDKAAVLDLTASPEYSPKWKLMGTSLPGYHAGTFFLRNGQSALVFLSDRSRVLSVPMTNGKLLLLSCEDPKKVLSALFQEGDSTPQPTLF